MSDWFLEKEIQEDIEFKNLENQMFTPLYRHEKTWLDRTWVQRTIEIVTNPIIIVITIIVCSSVVLILGGYDA